MSRILCLALAVAVQTAPRSQAFFQSPYPIDQVRNKQAVVETTAGTFDVELLPDTAPNHVGLFVKTAREGAYAKTLIHRVIRYGLIQGGDPLSKDPAKAAEYGTGGLNQLRPEVNKEPMTAGAVAAVLVPNRPDSGGAQFFVCATDQVALQGQYTVFGRDVETPKEALTVTKVNVERRSSIGNLVGRFGL